MGLFSGKYDHDCMEKIHVVGEWVESAIGAVLLFAGIIGIWFIGCAVI